MNVIIKVIAIDFPLLWYNNL